MFRTDVDKSHFILNATLENGFIRVYLGRSDGKLFISVRVFGPGLRDPRACDVEPTVDKNVYLVIYIYILVF